MLCTIYYVIQISNNFHENQSYIYYIFYDQQYHLGLLIKDPLKRLCRDSGKAESQVKSHAFFKSIDWNALEAKQIPPPFRPRVVSGGNYNKTICKLLLLNKDK